MTADISVARALFCGFVAFGIVAVGVPYGVWAYRFSGRLRSIQLGIAAVSGGLAIAFLLAAGVAKVVSA